MNNDYPGITCITTFVQTYSPKTAVAEYSFTDSLLSVNNYHGLIAIFLRQASEHEVIGHRCPIDILNLWKYIRGNIQNPRNLAYFRPDQILSATSNMLDSLKTLLEKKDSLPECFMPNTWLRDTFYSRDECSQLKVNTPEDEINKFGEFSTEVDEERFADITLSGNAQEIQNELGDEVSKKVIAIVRANMKNYVSMLSGILEVQKEYPNATSLAELRNFLIENIMHHYSDLYAAYARDDLPLQAHDILGQTSGQYPWVVDAVSSVHPGQQFAFDVYRARVSIVRPVSDAPETDADILKRIYRTRAEMTDYIQNNLFSEFESTQDIQISMYSNFPLGSRYLPLIELCQLHRDYENAPMDSTVVSPEELHRNWKCVYDTIEKVVERIVGLDLNDENNQAYKEAVSILCSRLMHDSGEKLRKTDSRVDIEDFFSYCTTIEAPEEISAHIERLKQYYDFYVSFEQNKRQGNFSEASIASLKKFLDLQMGALIFSFNPSTKTFDEIDFDVANNYFDAIIDPVLQEEVDRIITQCKTTQESITQISVSDKISLAQAFNLAEFTWDKINVFVEVGNGGMFMFSEHLLTEAVTISRHALERAISLLELQNNDTVSVTYLKEIQSYISNITSIDQGEFFKYLLQRTRLVFCGLIDYETITDKIQGMDTGQLRFTLPIIDNSHEWILNRTTLMATDL